MDENSLEEVKKFFKKEKLPGGEFFSLFVRNLAGISRFAGGPVRAFSLPFNA